MKQQFIQKFFVICFFALIASCSNTNSSGIGLTGAPTKPPKDPDAVGLTAKITDTYKSTLAIPDVGFTKTIEFTESLQLASYDDCLYTIQETSVLLQKDKTVLIDFQYKQTPDKENISSCPEKIDKYNNHKKDIAFEKYVNNKISVFMSSSDVDTILRANPDFKSGQVLTMESRKFGEIDSLFVRIKLVDLNNEPYLLETHFSSLNSFLDIIDRKYISMKSSKVISYRKLITQ